MENTDKQLQAIEEYIRMESLYDKETTDILVEAVHSIQKAGLTHKVLPLEQPVTI